jgi:hypothetical protein
MSNGLNLGQLGKAVNCGIAMFSISAGARATRKINATERYCSTEYGSPAESSKARPQNRFVPRNRTETYELLLKRSGARAKRKKRANRRILLAAHHHEEKETTTIERKLIYD